ncbi:MAG: hypothetical protein A3I14_05200 [Candidatus Rokubacteria bacterium RIFCSPLOWO2_02_FULL_73_56]|nr:MAG: hypothetical protein A3D33_06580 [Candidatus Rokubacteria bacterium RIFCSPHIGHO2_02_FULL_73_26]OGL13467.1 MAG: hypothetical protein A3I14_05200 [Candidatus Rokubacteria bacterium RIFCSPLOWO2_02_FULL_73_56]OGL27868.1 MAG: hypothetical protein A3G44_04355 [Candidatus Rokubacteria bacterium RIFCSPLOWO2_12_FULL_73_47]
MRLRSIVLSAIAGVALAGWLGWPAARPIPAAVDFGGPCSGATRQWVEEWRRARVGGRDVQRVYVLCQLDGRTHAAFASWRSPDGDRILSWRPVTTFIGELPTRCRERIDVFDSSGRLVEYATLDRETRRVEFYSAGSRLTGHGALDASSGRVERFGPEGQRHWALPVPPGLEGDGATRMEGP